MHPVKIGRRKYVPLKVQQLKIIFIFSAENILYFQQIFYMTDEYTRTDS